MQTIAWSELVTLMVHGPDLPTRGRLHHEDGRGSQARGWIRTSGTPTPPPFATGVQVSMWGPRLRLADSDGRLSFITDGTTAWTFDTRTPDAPPLESPLEHVEFGLAGSDVLVRTTARAWLDHDVPTRPRPTSTTFAGRAAWSIVLSPPYRTPGIVQVVVDAETGMLLQQRDDETGCVTEWTEVLVGAELDPADFTWTGPAVPWHQQLEATRGRNERRQAAWEEERARWTSEQLGLERVSLTLEADLLVDDLQDDGTLVARLGQLGSLYRRPRSLDPWPDVDLDDPGDGSVYRWADDEWDWAARVWDGHLAPASAAALRAQLEATNRPA